MAQLVDALALEAKCCRFESDLEHHFHRELVTRTSRLVRWS